MAEYTKEEVQAALAMVDSLIGQCEKSKAKCAEGTSQDTLLQNRIKALSIAKALMEGETVTYTTEELKNAVQPISAMIHKCETAQNKFTECSSPHNRLKNMIQTLDIARTLIRDEIDKRNSIS